jgi:subtilase family serine protease
MRVALIIAISFGLFGVVALGFRHATATPASGGGVEEVDQGLQGPGLARHPLYIKIHGRDSRVTPLITSSTPRGYTPAQIRSYLGLTGDGSGQTIAIVDAYDDPNIIPDLNTFSGTFGLPLVCGTAGANASSCLNITKAMPQGQPATNAGWSLEIALDVEWAHAVAPKASILLVEAASNSFSNLMGAIDYAASHGAAVISNSYGAGEFSGETTYDSHCILSSAVCTFSTGDSGNPGGYPAYNPYVVAVGGTTLNLTSSGAVSGESAWSGSGGGVSQYEARPSYQTSVSSSARRGIPDVSYDADPNTGFAVYDSVTYQGQSGWFQIGGTSAGAPQWAAIIAVADQLRAASSQPRLTGASFAANTAIYALQGASALADITSGSNGSCGSVCTASPGYDFVTGLGSPRTGIDAALNGSVIPSPTATATPGGASTAIATGTATATSTPAGPTATPTNTPVATPTSCPPGQRKRGAC